MSQKKVKSSKYNSKIKLQKKSKNFLTRKVFFNRKLLKRRRRKLFFITAFLVVGLVIAYVYSLNIKSDIGAVNAIESFQAGEISWSPMTSVMYSTDSSASNGQAIILTSNATGKVKTFTSGTASELRVTATRAGCFFNAPSMEVKLDGKSLGSQTVDSGKWKQYSFKETIRPGPHEIEVSFTNQYKFVFFGFWTVCHNTLSIDKAEMSISKTDQPASLNESNLSYPMIKPTPSSSPSKKSSSEPSEQSLEASPNFSNPSVTSGASMSPSVTQPPIAGRNTTFTLEPFDFDGYIWMNMNITREQLGGTMCPCVKIPYIADALPTHVQEGADMINKWMTNGTIKSGDTVMGFSLGAQTVSLYLSQHTPLAGVKFLLLGDTFYRNQEMLDFGKNQFAIGGIPWNIPNQITLVANEFDGYSDKPDIATAPGYSLARQVSYAGMTTLHNYRKAKLSHPANVVTRRGNLTQILIPTQKMPGNVFESQRSLINQAYSRSSPTVAQLAAASDQQVWP